MAVTVFFVLSSFVITHVAAERETNLRLYAVSRLARVYSVALPAILLVIILDWTGHLLGSHRTLQMYQYHAFWKYAPMFLTFTSQSVFAHEYVLSDHSFWSLCY
ncbi:MAG TPA: hypothetical protein VHU23_16965 [Rhizomicrobium sp.]|jgi:peptidoglycan/LPS O-acetylase OafA/YrhL|nr:hypothetical protein [Rhizomicrobium sp.]